MLRSRWTTLVRAFRPRHAETESDAPPIRGEVFGIERLEEHARTWAQQDRLLPPGRRGPPLLRRLAENQQLVRDLKLAGKSALETTAMVQAPS